MTTDFPSATVLANTARSLRDVVLPTVTDDHARRTLVQLIAVIEHHLDELAGRPDDSGLLSAFGGRLAERPDPDDDPSVRR